MPAVAVLELLRGAPVQSGRATFESTTPTGAALLSTLVTSWGPTPQMRVGAVGTGAGTRDADEIVNALRLVLGEAAHAAIQLDANIDDLDPRLWPGVITALLDSGAHDARLTPIMMKKGRPAFTLSVLCTPHHAAALREAVFREITTIGLREFPVSKHSLDRSESTVEVDGKTIRVQTASLGVGGHAASGPARGW